MKRLIPVTVASVPLLVPALALAAVESEAPGLFSLTLQMAASLAVVLGLIYLFYHISNRWLRPGVQSRGGERHIRLVETRYLSPKKSLILVEVGGEYLLLGSSGENLTFIKEIDILEEIEVIEERDKGAVASIFQGRLDAVAAKIASMRQGRDDVPGNRAGRQ